VIAASVLSITGSSGCDLSHRTFVFRANFHSGMELGSQLAELWTPISTDLSIRLSQIITDPVIRSARDELIRSHVIVDLSDNRVKPVTINVHAEDGLLEQPNLSFDPSRWSNVYDLQKRTGYVFAPRRMVSLVGLAASIGFFEKWGYAGGVKGRRLVKSGSTKLEGLQELLAAGAIDQTLFDVLHHERAVLFFVRPEQLKLPPDWSNVDPQLAEDLTDKLRNLAPRLVTHDVSAVVLTKQNMSESELQEILLRFNRSKKLKASEGQGFAGGETDVILQERCLIENKIDTSGKDPFVSKPEAAYQANRYARSISQRVFFTLVAYRPNDEAAIHPPAASVRVRQLDGLPQTAVEVRFVVPMGLSDPSRTKVPVSMKAS
jgi:hypothetical protein